MPPKRQRKDLPPAVTPEEIAVVHRLIDATGSAPIVGGPVRCPACPGWGMAEALDRITLRFEYRCPSCAETWVLSVAALRAARAQPTPPVPAWPTAGAADGVDRSEAPVVRLSWGSGSATSATSAAPHPAG